MSIDPTSHTVVVLMHGSCLLVWTEMRGMATLRTLPKLRGSELLHYDTSSYLGCQKLTKATQQVHYMCPGRPPLLTASGTFHSLSMGGGSPWSQSLILPTIHASMRLRVFPSFTCVAAATGGRRTRHVEGYGISSPILIGPQRQQGLWCPVRREK